jgi:hypothetical protein
MPATTGSFTGYIRMQTATAADDQSNHELSLAEIAGTQKSSDELWNNAQITYWGVTDLVEGNGSQRGYYSNRHTNGSREWGTFEGKVSTSGSQVTVDGAWQIAGGDGVFKGATGKGTFKSKMKSPREIETTWQGAYELASKTARARS